MSMLTLSPANQDRNILSPRSPVQANFQPGQIFLTLSVSLVVTPKPPAAPTLLPPLYLQSPRSNSPGPGQGPREKTVCTYTPYLSQLYSISLAPLLSPFHSHLTESQPDGSSHGTCTHHCPRGNKPPSPPATDSSVTRRCEATAASRDSQCLPITLSLLLAGMDLFSPQPNGEHAQLARCAPCTTHLPQRERSRAAWEQETHTFTVRPSQGIQDLS